MAMILAGSFANSPAGYVTGVYLPIIATFLFGLFLRKMSVDAAFRKSITDKFEAQESAMAEQSRALAVIVQRVDDAGTTLAKVPGIEAATAVLKQRLDTHDAWAEQARRELNESVSRVATRNNA